MNDLAQLTKAATFAAKKHTRQKRKGANSEPYINHPLEVADLLSRVGKIEDCDILTAAILHDVLEDTDTCEDEIERLFGTKVCNYVKEVTDDKNLPKTMRKELQIEHAPHLSFGAKQIKLADKISNIDDIIENPPENWSVERRLEYIDWSQKVIAGVRGTNFDLDREFFELVQRARKELAAE